VTCESLASAITAVLGDFDDRTYHVVIV